MTVLGETKVQNGIVPGLGLIGALALGAPAQALTYNFAGGTAEVTSTKATVYLQPSKGDTLDLEQTGTGDVTVQENLADPETATFHDMRAQQKADGTSEISYFGSWVDVRDVDRVNATFQGTTEITYEVTNTGASATFFRFDYSLTGMFIELFGGGFGPGINTPASNANGGLGGTLAYSVSVDGQSLRQHSLQFWAYYNADGSQVITGSDAVNMTPSITQTDLLSRADVADISDTVNLGVFAAGSTKTVRVFMGAVGVHTAEADIRLGISDPNLFNGNISASPAVAPVPLPPGGWLLMVGLGAMGALRAHRRRG